LNSRCIYRLAVIGALIAALGVTGCGRKSGLDPPPAAAISNGDDPAKRDANMGVDESGKPVAARSQRKSFYPLDWLLD
jgi:predicted small lipoprotein YifL